MRLLKFLFILLLLAFILTCLLLVLTRVVPIGSKAKEVFFLGTLSKTFPEQMYTVPEGEIAYHQAGTGTNLILFIHGSPGLWDAFAGYMSDDALVKNIMVAYDRPGYGDTTVPGSYTLEDQARAAHELIQHFRRPAIVVAHSFGGAIASELAYNYPADVKALVLIAPTLEPDGELRLWFKRLSQNIVLSPLGALGAPDMQEASLEMHHMPEEMTLLAPHLADVKIPITILHGDRDFISPVSNIDYAQSIFKNAKLTETVIKSGTHFLPWTNEEEITAAILKSI